MSAIDRPNGGQEPFRSPARAFNRLKSREVRAAQVAAHVLPPERAPSPPLAWGARSIAQASDDGVEVLDGNNLFEMDAARARRYLADQGFELSDEEWGEIAEAGLRDFGNRLNAMNLALANLAMHRHNVKIFALAMSHVSEEDKAELRALLAQFISVL